MVWSEGEGEREGEEGVVPYDHLILCTGLQFKPPPSVTSDGDLPLIYDPNEGLDIPQWVEEYLQPQGTYGTPSQCPVHHNDVEYVVRNSPVCVM